MTHAARLVCIASLTLAGTAGATHHEAAEAPAQAWDQAQVTALAGELSAAVKGLRDSFRAAGSPPGGSMQGRAFLDLKDKLRRIQNESRHLAGSLAEGDGLEETLPVYRNLWVLVRDARELAQRLFIEKPIQDRILIGRAKLDALAVYYPPE